VMELLLTMLLRLALERLYASGKPAGLPGSSMLPLPLPAGGGDLDVLPCTHSSRVKWYMCSSQLCYMPLQLLDCLATRRCVGQAKWVCYPVLTTGGFRHGMH